MKAKWFRFLAIVTAVVVLVGAAAFFIEREREESELGGEAEYPTALGNYLEKQREAVTGPEEGPGSAAEIAYQQRAYPADSISVAQMNEAAANITMRPACPTSR